MEKNVFGEPLQLCCTKPMTGYFRDGFCNTDEHDYGSHVVCAVMTDDFLEFSKSKGNDLSTPRPEFNLEGALPDGIPILFRVLMIVGDGLSYLPDFI